VPAFKMVFYEEMHCATLAFFRGIF